MKVAICFSGQPRTVEKTYHEYTKPNLFDCNPDCEFDVFVHTWFDREDVGQRYQNAGGHAASSVTPPNVIDKIFELYNPTKSLIEKQVQFDERDYATRKYPGIIPFYSLSKMNSIQRANDLKIQYEIENDFSYDIVISHRFDLAIKAPMILNECESGVLYHLAGCPHPESINVIMTVANTIVNDHYADLIDSVDEYWRQDGISFCDEPLAYHHMVKWGYKPETFSLPYELLKR